jgi:hypothetical protein
MAEQKFPAGSIFIDSITIQSDLGGDPFDLKAVVREFSIYESLTSPFLTGDLLIGDALSLVNIVPIVGQETVHIKFKTPHDSVLKDIDVTFRVMSVENGHRIKPRMMGYIIHLASAEYLTNLQTRVQQSYRQKTTSEMVQDIHKTYLQSQKTLTASETEGQRTIVIPNMKPTKAIDFLIRESKSATYKASNFLYFENCDGFQFVTVDELITKRHPVIDKYWSTLKNWERPDSSPRDDAGTGAGGGARQSTKPYDMLKFDHFEFIHLFNADRVGVKGGWENTSYYLDPIYSEFTQQAYDYITNFGDIKHTGKGGKFISQDNNYVNAKTSMQNLFMTNKSGSGVDKDQKPDYYHIMAGSFGLLDNVLVEVTIPGDTERRAGDRVNLQFPEWGATTDIEGKINRYTSGEYLVLGIRHIYNGSGYSCVMQCVKNAYDQDVLPSNPTESLSEGQEVTAEFPARPTGPISTNGSSATPVTPVWPNSNGEKV